MAPAEYAAQADSPPTENAADAPVEDIATSSEQMLPQEEVMEEQKKPSEGEEE